MLVLTGKALFLVTTICNMAKVVSLLG